MLTCWPRGALGEPNAADGATRESSSDDVHASLFNFGTLNLFDHFGVGSEHTWLMHVTPEATPQQS